MSLFNRGNAPGFETALETEEAQVFRSGRGGQTMVVDSPRVTVLSSSVDAGNTPTTTLRGGNLMALVDASAKANTYSADATDGRQVPVGVLEAHLSMLQQGVAADRMTTLVQSGLLKQAELVGSDQQALNVLTRVGFGLDAVSPYGGLFLVRHKGVYRKSSNYTVTTSDNGMLLIATAAVNFTLPTKANGLAFEFLQTADANMVITGSTDIVVIGNAAASTVTYSTANQKIGSRIRVQCIYTAAGTLKWIVENLGSTTMTIA